MENRDWGHGDLAPHERQATDAWPHDDPPPDESAPPSPQRPGEARPTDRGGNPRDGGRHRDEDRGGAGPTYRAAWARWPGTDTTGSWRQAAADRHRSAGRQPDDTGQWTYDPEMYDRGTPPGIGWWDRSTDTGQWDRFTDTGEWNRGDLAHLDGSPDGHTHRPRHGEPETFWEGTRLAGDDPRWMATPASAPQSPAVSHPDRVDNLPTVAARHAERGRPEHPLGVPVRDADRGGPLVAMLYATAWYVVPLLVLFVWMLTLDGSAPAGCLTDATGAGCESPRAVAAGAIVAAAPLFGAALGASVVVAGLLRWMSRGWRATSIGLAAAVIGGGLSTVLFQFIAGEPIG